MRRVPARDAARCSDRQWDVVVVGAGVALEHWRGLGELLARRKYAQLSAAQRSACNRHNEDTRRRAAEKDNAMPRAAASPWLTRSASDLARICTVWHAQRLDSSDARRAWRREVFGRAPVAASVVALLTTAQLGRRSEGNGRPARRCVAVAQRRRRAGQTAVAACVLGTRADGEADAADTNHAQVHA